MEISGKPMLHYFAGIFDGEGTVQTNVPRPSRRNYFAALYITNTNKELLQMLHKEFGGFIQGPYKNGKNSKLIYRLTWHGQKARPILAALLSVPFLLVKKRQAALAQEFENIRSVAPNYHGRKGYGDEVRAKLLRIHEEIKHLNKRGIVATSETKPESGLEAIPPAIDSPRPLEIEGQALIGS